MRSSAYRPVRVLALLATIIFATLSAARAQDEPVAAPTASPGATKSAQKIAPTPGQSPGATPQPVLENAGVATKTTVYGDQIRSTDAQNTYDAIKNVPGVIQADAKAGGGADNLQLRGIHLSSSTGYRLDGGLPILNNIALFPDDKEQVQILKGAGALEYGFSSASGLINYVLKRATRTPVTSFGFASNAFGQALYSLDVGRRFGSPASQFGLRFNYVQGEIGSYVNGAGGNKWLYAMTGDWRTRKSLVQVDFENFGIDLIEQASLLETKVAANGLIPLPSKFPDPSQLLSGVWARGIGTVDNFATRGTYWLTPGVSVRAEVGHSISDRPQRFVSQFGNYNVTTGKGTETVSLVRDQVFTNTYANVEMRLDAKFSTSLTNEFVFGYTRNARLFNNPVNGSASYTQNLYTPIVLPAPKYPAGPITYQPQNSLDFDYFFHDALSLYDRVHLTGGLRQINYRADNVQPNGTPDHTTSAFLAPGLGAVIDVTRSIALYGSYVRSLEETGSAPANSKNAFAILPPAPATQQEIGLRTTRTRGVVATLGYFTINRANATTDPVTNIFALNGTNTFEGVEASVSVNAGRHWNMRTSGQFMNATQHSPGDPTINGKTPENTPRLTGAFAVTFRPSQGLSFLGEANSFGPRQLNPQNQGTLPSVTLFNVGANYTFRTHNERLSLALNCKNLADKRYYSSAVNGALGIGPPRTVYLSIRTTTNP